MNISNTITDYFQVKLDNFLLAFHLSGIAISGSTNEKIYKECRQKCGSKSSISYTEVAEALRIQRQVKESGEWNEGKWLLLQSTVSKRLVSVNAEGEVTIHCRNRGQQLGQGAEKKACIALWLKSDNTVQPIAELVASQDAVDSVVAEDKLAEKVTREAKLSLATTGSTHVFKCNYSDEYREAILLQPLAERDLQSYIKNSVTLNINQVAEKCMGMAKSIAEFHKADYIHCDIKPGNFLEYKKGDIKLTDWGSVVKKEDGETEKLKGTKFFIAPEVPCQDSLKFSSASDIYALGKSFRMFLARIPTEDRDNEEYRAMEALATTMCSQNHEKRPTAEKVVAELEKIFPKP